jgi:uncharacterized protein YdiU (UPF0061 family)
VARVAPTFVRFGNFEIMAAMGELENLRLLADYVIRRHYPELGEPAEAVYLRWFEEVCRRTAVMIAGWMTVGFVHGVMNTDNMSILGVTIDYGPYGWLEPYEPQWTPNTTDFAGRRYAFGEQPRVALWNLLMLARAISPLVSNGEDLTSGLEAYRTTLAETHRELMLRKLGLAAGSLADDEALFKGLEGAMVESGVDMTRFFRSLSLAAPELLTNPDVEAAVLQEVIDASVYPGTGDDHTQLTRWLAGYAVRLRAQSHSAEAIGRSMLAANPKYVLRNYLAQNAIEAAEAGDLAPLQRLMHVLRTPYDEHPEHDELAARRPDWAAVKPGSATLSCSS